MYSEGGKVVWSVASDTFTVKIERETRLDPGSVAFDWQHRRKIDERAQPIAADVWLPTRKSVEIIEHSTVLPTTDGVITLLWVPEAVAAQLKMAG